MAVETQVLPLDALAGKLAPYSDHVTCDLLSLSKIKWLLYSIDFLPCGGAVQVLSNAFHGGGAPWSP